MQSDIADKLLAKVMGWSPADVADERPKIQALARYRYDEYQKYSPGMRFVESLAIWLRQFGTIEEKKVAYKFATENLVFFSNDQINHLIGMVYLDNIKPQLLNRVARTTKIPEFFISKLIKSKEYQICERQCLFLGLSDGARIDIFRRSNSMSLSHEQILSHYDFTSNRADEMLKKLRLDIEGITGRSDISRKAKFNTVVLLDDFSGSGTSFIRPSGVASSDDGKPFRRLNIVFNFLKRVFGREQEEVNVDEYEGKFPRILKKILDKTDGVSHVFELAKLEIVVVFYVSTTQSEQAIKQRVEDLLATYEIKGITVTYKTIALLDGAIKIFPGKIPDLDKLIEKYYDHEAFVDDPHFHKGGGDARYGFANCGLPVAFHHNTPNNSIALLWSDTDKTKALFPRISRHKKS